MRGGGGGGREGGGKEGEREGWRAEGDGMCPSLVGWPMCGDYDAITWQMHAESISIAPWWRCEKREVSYCTASL